MNNIDKGYQYDIFKNYLNTLNNIKIAYVWKDIPEYLLFDYGFMGYAHNVAQVAPVKSYNYHRLNRKTNNINKLEDIGSDIIYIRNSLLIDSDGSRDLKEINEFIKNNSKIFLSVTYKSCDIICEIIDKLENVFILFDEFNNFSYNNIYDESDNIYKFINNDNIKKLYLSATPRIYELEDNNDIDVNEIFGDYIYKMSFNEAIGNKYISDYELYLPIFDSDINQEINNSLNLKNLVQNKNNFLFCNIHQDYLLKLQFLIEAIKMQGNLKVIVYVRTHEEIDTFISEFNKLNEYYAYDVDINKITCNDSYTNRTKILNDFNNSIKINILLSVHILDEAIDIPSCNSMT